MTAQASRTGFQRIVHRARPVPGPFAHELARWDVGSWHYVETRIHREPASWKITMNTFTEGYHIPGCARTAPVPPAGLKDSRPAGPSATTRARCSP